MPAKPDSAGDFRGDPWRKAAPSTALKLVQGRCLREGLQ